MQRQVLTGKKSSRMSVKSEIRCMVILNITDKLCEQLVLSGIFWFLTVLLFSDYPSNVSKVYYYIHGKKKGRKPENYFPPGNKLSFRSHIEPALCTAWEAKGANKKIRFPQSWGAKRNDQASEVSPGCKE